MSERMRVHNLAKELNVKSKSIIEKCRAEGITSVKNHMSTLSAGLEATVREWFSEGTHSVAVETTERVDLKKVRIRPSRKKAKKSTKPAAPQEEPPATVAEQEVPPTVVEAEPAIEPKVEVADETPPAPPPTDTGPDTASPPAEAEPETALDAAADADKDVSTADAAAEAPPPAELAETPAKDEVQEAESTEPDEPSDPVAPAGPQHVPAPAKLHGPRVVRYEAPERDVPPVRRGPRRSPDDDTSMPTPGELPMPGTGKGSERGGGRRRGRSGGRRGSGGMTDAGERIAEWRDRDLAERQARLAGATGRRMARRRAAKTVPGQQPQAAAGPKTKATVHEPIRMKEFCAETGISFIQLLKVLRDDHGIVANINMVLPSDTAQLLAMHYGLELEVIAAKTKLDELKEEFQAFERKNTQPRPPVVAMLGHVDHGKTSLLDGIRKTHVVSDEDGGITQHISSYKVDTPHGSVTFLDTPGHEAFTAMRARGAQITDVVVLVIAADDGVMPQTVEAINHIKAAGVPVVVALNKIDLGDQNKVKIYGQLAEHGLAPAGDWGGEVDVIPTSATTNVGMTELVEHLAELSSLLELECDPTLPAVGTVIEAETKAGVGAVAQVLIRDGTIHVGDFVVCGNAAGKVRALLDDRGQKITEAGPSCPVEIWGLDDVPSAGDELYQITTLQRAKDIATETKHKRAQSSRVQSRKVKSLQEMLQQRDEQDVPELNVVIKGDVDGSISALTGALSEIPSDEVKLSIRHAGVGPVNDSDVLLAATCDGIVIAYRVEVSVGARKLCDQHGVDVRSYRVIYDVCDDIKKALEGLLAPEESRETRATAEVRELFRLSRKAGVIAGSMVTDGTLNRSHLAKVIRDGVIVREGAAIASLRRFKDDVKEVRAGMECGIRLEGFDDIHVGDIIEAYEVIKTARTL